MDTYTRIVLTVIAAALVLISVRGLWEPVTVAHAAEELACRFSGPLELRSFGDTLEVDIDDTIKVEVKSGFNQAGSSSSSPLYVKMVD